MTSFSFAFQSERAFSISGNLALDKTALEVRDSYGSSSSQKQDSFRGHIQQYIAESSYEVPEQTLDWTNVFENEITLCTSSSSESEQSGF